MTDNEYDLSAIDGISPEMRKRLHVMIDRKFPNFILIGSDPAVEGGCCPSTDVGHANRLVEAGILETWRAGCGANACPGNFYAFRGEKVPDTCPPEFRLNEEMRSLVAERLPQAYCRGSVIRKLLMWVLLMFVALCLCIVTVREFRGAQSSDHNAYAIINKAALETGEGYLVCVIKTARACSSCEAMQAYTQKTLSDHYQAEVDNGRIRFATVSAAGESNREFREKTDILATTLVLIKIRNGTIQEMKKLPEAWQHLKNEDAFIDMLQRELKAFTGEE